MYSQKQYQEELGKEENVGESSWNSRMSHFMYGEPYSPSAQERK